MSGFSQGHELAKSIWKKLWLRVPGEVEIHVKEGVTSLNMTYWPTDNMGLNLDDDYSCH